MTELSEGTKWTVFHLKKENTLKQRIVYSAKSDVEFVLMNSMEFYLNYDKVATFDFHGMTSNSLWRLTNNVDESWLSEFAGEHENWTMTNHTSENGARSSMVGDIFQDKTNMNWFVIQPLGFKQIHWLKDEPKGGKLHDNEI